VPEAFTLHVSLVLGTPFIDTALERHTLFFSFKIGNSGRCLASGSVRALGRSDLLITELPLFIHMSQVGEFGLPTLGFVQEPTHGAFGVTLMAEMHTRLSIVTAYTVERDLELVHTSDLSSGTLRFRCKD